MSYADCCEIVTACKTAGVILAVCHVLRYLPQARKITDLIQSGCIGEVVNIQHMEPVSSCADIERDFLNFYRNQSKSTSQSQFRKLPKLEPFARSFIGGESENDSRKTGLDRFSNF